MHAVLLDAKTLGWADLGPMEAACDSLVRHQVTPPEQTSERCQEAEIVITNKVLLDETIIKQCPKLKLIVVAATGTNNIDLDASSKRGITVCNVPDYAGPAVSQYVFAQLLALKHQTFAYRDAMQNGLWPQSPVFSCLNFPIDELAGKTMGIIGFGTLGQSVAKLAEAFGMQVLIAERKNSAACRPGRIPFKDVLRQADVLSLHCPLTPQTDKLIDTDALSLMKPDAILINTARGPVVDEYALAQALKHKRIGGAIIDVLSQEPPQASHPLLNTQEPNLIVTPHIAWATEAAVQRLVNTVADNIRHFVAGQPHNKVSTDS
ncbi:Phosphoglycerate dehydrogenase [Saliniradius amylolyticus]|uniref:Phosphoglycerate dehydrogenase n=1 Tax=Saliniradius amylolyticus TaxID=2183582 RepID=A0A2S2E3X5_9ALTE|nr:D-2-hydroxyacid dehydrogenase [Saliniradius amylolyticus]AWL12358.1 Phosphoglycerate dehydrogenase [Saliniradius amylolyticus]